MKLKTRPNDFRVDELLADGYLRDRGDHTVFHVRKKKLTSLEAAEVLARELGVEPSDVSMAGLKDRQGVTTQYMSVPGRRSLRLSDAHLSVDRAGYAVEPYGAEHSLGNGFRIRIRDLDARDLDLLRANREHVERHGVPSYFDDQRFGNLRHGQGWVAKELMLGRAEQALRAFVAAPSPHDDPRTGAFKAAIRKEWGNWGDCREIANRFHRHQSLFAHLKREPEDFAGAFHRLSTRLRLIHLYAWQSHVWNRALALWISEAEGVDGASVSTGVEGVLVFPRGELPAPPDLPLPGPRLDNVEDPAARALLERVLAHEGLRPEQWDIEGVPGFQLKGEPRAPFVRPEGLALDVPDAVDPRKGRAVAELAFRLPRGCYATLVVRALLAHPVRGRVDTWRPGTGMPRERDDRRDDARHGRDDRRGRGRDDRGDRRGGRDERGDRRRGREERGGGRGFGRHGGGGDHGRSGDSRGYGGRSGRGGFDDRRGSSERGEHGHRRDRDDRSRRPRGGAAGGGRSEGFGERRGSGWSERGRRDDRGGGGSSDRGRRDERGGGGRSDRGRRDDRGGGGWGDRGRRDERAGGWSERGRRDDRAGSGSSERGRREERGGGRGSGGARGPSGDDRGRNRGGGREDRRRDEPGRSKRYVSEDDRRRARGEGPRLTRDPRRRPDAGDGAQD